jgi:hypothetical protein
MASLFDMCASGGGRYLLEWLDKAEESERL